jgi:hypothetical protein
MRVVAALLLLLALQQDLEKRRDATAEKLESLRGLKFKKPLSIREGTRREYAAYVLENAKRVYGEDLAAADKGLKAMGLVSPKLRLELALTMQAGLGVKLWCANGEILLLDRSADGEWLVNKMDLGLVDQHFQPKIAPTFDAQMAFAALRMGDAEVAKLLFRHNGKLPAALAKQAAEEAATWEKSDSKLASAVVPRLFVRAADFPWRRGGAFALALYGSGGQAALDKAFADPPVSTEQVIHPEKYIKGGKPATIDLASAEAFLKDKGYAPGYHTVLGELGVALVLETHLSREDTSAASEGWAGDTFAVFEKEGVAPLVVWATEWDTEKDATEFQAEALKVALKLMPAEPNIMAPVLKKKTSVAFALNVPKEMQDGLLDSVWKSKRTRDKTVDLYGE